MASKPSAVARITDYRPNFPSGNFGVLEDIRGANNFEELVNSGQIRQFGTNEWIDIKQAQKTKMNGLRAAGSVVGKQVKSFVSFFSEELETATLLNIELGITAPEFLDTLYLHTNKASFYKSLESSDITLPYWNSTSNGIQGVKEILESDKTIPENIFIKPSCGSGSIGVFKGTTSDSETLLAQVSLAVEDVSNQTELLLIEAIDRFEDVNEIAVNAVIRNSKVVSVFVHDKIKQSTAPPYRDFMLATPSLQVGFDIKGVTNLVKEIVNSTSIENSLLQLEVRIDKNGSLIPIDTALRPDGGLMPDSIFESYGLDFRLLHLYFISGLYDEVDRLLLASKSMNNNASAIGAFYADSVSINESGFSFEDRIKIIRRLEPSIKIHYKIESSNFGFVDSEFEVSLCAKGASQTEAVSNLKAYALILGVEMGDKFI